MILPFTAFRVKRFFSQITQYVDMRTNIPLLRNVNSTFWLDFLNRGENLVLSDGALWDVLTD